MNKPEALIEIEKFKAHLQGVTCKEGPTAINKFSIRSTPTRYDELSYFRKEMNIKKRKGHRR